jgi:hypothetical protein
METNEKLLELVQDSEQIGNIQVMTSEGLTEYSLLDIISLDTESILNKLNRTKESIIELSENPKNKRWVNDYATVVVLEYIKKQYSNLLSQYDDIKEEYMKLLGETYDETSTVNITEQQVNNVEIKQPAELKPITDIHQRVDRISAQEMFRI